MGFGHEKLDVYRAAIEYVGWAYRFCENLKGHRNAKDQLLRASQAIPLDRIVAMLTKLGQRGYTMHEARAAYTTGNDTDTDIDSDPEADGHKPNDC